MLRADSMLLVVLKSKNHTSNNHSGISMYIYMLFNMLQLSS